MGQKASKRDNTVLSRPAPTEPRLPGFWKHQGNSLVPAQPIYHQPIRPASISYVSKPTSYSTFTETYNRFLLNLERADNNQSIYRHQDEGSRKTHEFDELSHQIKLRRQSALNETYIHARSVPTPPTINSILPIAPRLQFNKENDIKYFSRKQRRPELTNDMVRHIESMKTSPHHCVLGEIDGAQISGKDIRTLIGLNWLNDEIINAYMSLLVCRGKKPDYKAVHSFNTFFYPKLRESGYNSVRRWTRKVDIFGFSYIIVPVHLGNHWTLVFIDFQQRTISYYDSLGGYADGHCDTLLDYLRSEMSDKKKQEFSDSGWRLVNRSQEGIPQQNNCSDCGVFTCIYAEHLTREAELNFSQEDMPYYRDRMIYEITKQEILE